MAVNIPAIAIMAPFSRLLSTLVSQRQRSAVQRHWIMHQLSALNKDKVAARTGLPLSRAARGGVGEFSTRVVTTAAMDHPVHFL